MPGGKAVQTKCLGNLAPSNGGSCGCPLVSLKVNPSHATCPTDVQPSGPKIWFPLLESQGCQNRPCEDRKGAVLAWPKESEIATSGGNPKLATDWCSFFKSLFVSAIQIPFVDNRSQEAIRVTGQLAAPASGSAQKGSQNILQSSCCL